MFEDLAYQHKNVSSVFCELLIAYSPLIHISATVREYVDYLPPARITETRDVTTEMMDGAGFENEFVGVENG